MLGRPAIEDGGEDGGQEASDRRRWAEKLRAAQRVVRENSREGGCRTADLQNRRF